MRKGDLKLIAMAVGLHETSVQHVSIGLRKNEVVQELIGLAERDRVAFARKLKEEKESLDILVEAGLKTPPKPRTKA